MAAAAPDGESWGGGSARASDRMAVLIQGDANGAIVRLADGDDAATSTHAAVALVFDGLRVDRTR